MSKKEIITGKENKNNTKDKANKEPVKQETLKEVNKPKERPKVKQKKKIKPYVHIDTFLQTAKVMHNMDKVQVAGFKSRMNGKHYQRDEEVFNIELKNYLNIK